VIAAFGGGSGAAGAVAFSTDDGADWTQLPGSGPTALPSAAITGIAIDPNQFYVLYVTSNIGVFRGTLGSGATATWVPFDDGLPSGLDGQQLEVDATDNLLTIGTWGYGAYQRDITPGATCPAAFLVVRDNVLDRGLTPSPSGLPDPEHPVCSTDPATNLTTCVPDGTPGGALYWWSSTDIRIDVPAQDPATNQIARADSYEFETCPTELSTTCPVDTIIDRSPERGVAANAYVQVTNRGISPASMVRVIALFAPATTQAIELPSDFWSNTFPAGSSTCGSLDPSTGWGVVGCTTLPVINPDLPEVALLPWTVPADAAEHSTFVTIIDSPDDPLDATTRSTLVVSDLVRNDRHIAARNLHVIDAPPPGAFPRGKGSPHDGLTYIDVPNRSAAPGVDLVFSRSGMAGGRLQFLLPSGAASTTKGLPDPCGTSTTTGAPAGLRLVSFALPHGTSADQIAVAASGDLDIGPGAVIQGARGGPSLLASTDGSRTSIGPHARVGDVVSVAPTLVQPGATVTGSIASGGTIVVAPDATVAGSIAAGASLAPFDTTSWLLRPQGASRGDVDALRSTSRTLTPGTYGSVRVRNGAVLTLPPGRFVATSLTVDHGGRLILQGAVSLYVSQSLDLREAPAAGAGFTEALLVFFGDGVIVLPGGLHATVVAPKAHVVLADAQHDAYSGAIFARQVDVGAGVTLTHPAGGGLHGVAACSPLSAAERSLAASLGLDADNLYGVAGSDVTQHLPIAPGRTWRVGLRYEAAAVTPNTAQGHTIFPATRFSVVEKQQGVVVGGSSFVLRH
jgi:hypothetical protein